MVPRYRFGPIGLGEDRGGEREVVRQDGQGGEDNHGSEEVQGAIDGIAR